MEEEKFNLKKMLKKDFKDLTPEEIEMIQGRQLLSEPDYHLIESKRMIFEGEKLKSK